MPIQIVWDNEEHTILHHIYTGSWTWTEFQQSYEALNEMCNSVTHPVYSIIDLTNGNMIPKGSAVASLRSGARSLPANAADIAIAGDNLFLQVLSRIMASMPRMSRSRERELKLCKNLDAAREWIAGLIAQKAEL